MDENLFIFLIPWKQSGGVNRFTVQIDSLLDGFTTLDSVVSAPSLPSDRLGQPARPLSPRALAEGLFMV